MHVILNTYVIFYILYMYFIKCVLSVSLRGKYRDFAVLIFTIIKCYVANVHSVPPQTSIMLKVSSRQNSEDLDQSYT